MLLRQRANREHSSAQTKDVTTISCERNCCEVLLNSLTTVVSYLRPLFFYLREKLISPPIFVPSAGQGQRQLAELSGYMPIHFYFYEARSIDELSRGSFSCLDLIQVLLVKKYRNCQLNSSCVVMFGSTMAMTKMASAGPIRRKHLPGDRVYWLRMKPLNRSIGRCDSRRINPAAWPCPIRR